jgi:CDP-diglyceride synthetase
MDRLWNASLQAFTVKDADVFFVTHLSKAILIALILSGAYFLILWNWHRPRRSNKWVVFRSAVGFSIPLGLLAAVAGYLTGISRSPVVGTVVPAVLTFMGALSVYATAVTANQGMNKIAIGYSVFLFAFLFFHGVTTGAYQREYGNEGRIKALSQQELRIRKEREVLGLPVDPPKWLWSLD